MAFSEITRQRIILSAIPLLVGVVTVSVIVFVIAQSKPTTDSLPESEARTVVAEIGRHHSDWFTVESNLSRALNARELYRSMAGIHNDRKANLRDVQFPYFPKNAADFMYMEFELAATYESQLEAMHMTAQKHFNFYDSLMTETDDLRFQGDVRERIENWRASNPNPDWFNDVMMFEETAWDAYLRERRKKEDTGE